MTGRAEALVVNLTDGNKPVMFSTRDASANRVPADFRLIGELPQESFRCQVIEGPAAGCSWHHHPEFQLGLMISGSGNRIVGDHVCPLEPGDLVLLGSDLPHVWQYERCADAAPVHAIVVHFKEDFLGAEFLAKPELSEVRRLLRRAAVGLQVHGRTRKQVGGLLRGMVAHEGFDRLLDLLLILHQLAGSKELEPICSPGYLNRPPEAETERMKRVCAYLHEHLDRGVSRAAAAARAALSPAAFSRFFKAQAGKTFQEFVNELRIGRACRLLREGELNVTEIALTCGFSGAASFNRSFRRMKRTSPTDYRRKIRE